jgi:hypothetical protein
MTGKARIKMRRDPTDIIGHESIKALQEEGYIIAYGGYPIPFGWRRLPSEELPDGSLMVIYRHDTDASRVVTGVGANAQDAELAAIANAKRADDEELQLICRSDNRRF